MLDFLGNASSVLITVVVVAGFLALGALFVFELGTMLWFWTKHSLSDSSGDKTPDMSRNLGTRKGFRDLRQPS